MKLSKKALQFALVLPAATIAWLVVAIVGIYFYGNVLPVFCPSGFGAGRDCYAPYWPDLQFAVQLVFIGLSAIAVVSVSFLTAPSNKFRTALFIYIVGTCVATILAFESGWWSWLSATVSGALPLLLQRRNAGGGHLK